MRSLGFWVVVVGTAMIWSGDASAQVINKPIDTTSGIVKPVDTATNIFSGTSRYLSRVVASSVDSNGFVRTINNLFSRTSNPTTTQPNGLPLPSMYESTRYKNSFTPVMPRTMTYGRSP